jgi:hypothetical protein
MNEMDSAIEKGDCLDITKEAQDLLVGLFTVAKKPRAEPSSLREITPKEIASKDMDAGVLIEETLKQSNQSIGVNGEDTSVSNAQPASAQEAKPEEVTEHAESQPGSAQEAKPEEGTEQVESPASVQEAKPVEVLSAVSPKNASKAPFKRGSMAKLFMKKEKSASSATPSSPTSPGANGTSMVDIFQTFGNKGPKVKLQGQLFSGSFGEVWKGTFKDREVVVKKLFRDNGKFHAPVLRLFAEESSKIKTMKHERFRH